MNITECSEAAILQCLSIKKNPNKLALKKAQSIKVVLGSKGKGTGRIVGDNLSMVKNVKTQILENNHNKQMRFYYIK